MTEAEFQKRFEVEFQKRFQEELQKIRISANVATHDSYYGSGSYDITIELMYNDEAFSTTYIDIDKCEGHHG